MLEVMGTWRESARMLNKNLNLIRGACEEFRSSQTLRWAKEHMLTIAHVMMLLNYDVIHILY